MKKFLKYIFLFALPLVALCFGMEYMLRQIPNPYSFKRYLLEKKGAEIKNMIIGSSVVDYGIDPACLPDSTYNLALSGQWIRYNKAQLEKYINCLPNLKCVIWGISTQALWNDEYEEGIFYQDRVEDDQIACYNIYMDIRFDHNCLHASEFLSSSSTIWRKKWSKYYLQREKTMSCDSLGLDHSFDLSEKEEDEWLADIPKSARMHTVLHSEKSERVYRQNIQYMHEVAKLCYDKGVKLYIVVPPVYKIYYELIDNRQMQQMYAAIREVADKWENVSWHSYFKDIRFVEDDFYDANHLTSDIGAVKFAKILRKDLFE